MPSSLNYRTADIPTLLSDWKVQQLLKLVQQHPDWPLTFYVAQHPANIHSRKRKFTLEEATIVLKRLSLQFKSQRYNFAHQDTHAQGLADFQHIDYERADMATLLSHRYVQKLLEIATSYPHISSREMLNKLPKNSNGTPVLTYGQVKEILRRLKLATIEERMQRMGQDTSSASQKPQHTIPEVVSALMQYTEYKKEERQQTQPSAAPAPAQPQPFTQLAPLPAQPYTPSKQETFQFLDKFFSLTKQFTVLAFTSFLFFFGGSLLLSTLFHASGALQRIGMFFSFAALVCGFLFFLYSLKYYVTIALVLSFSRQDDSQNHTGIGGVFSKLFGVSVEIDRGSPTTQQPAKASLQYNLESVTLTRQPFVSIQVATYNEKRVIDRFLLAATSMEYDNCEVIVADDSADETVQLLEQWKTHPRVKISHRNTRAGYKGAALAEARKQTDPKAEFLLIFDADFIPYPDAITQFLKYFQASVGSLEPEAVAKSTIAAVQGYQWHILNRSENWITRGVSSTRKPAH